MFLRSISEIIIVTNIELHTFLKHARCPKGEGVTKFGQRWTRGRGGTDKGGQGYKNLKFCRTSFVNGPFVFSAFIERHSLLYVELFHGSNP